MAACRMTEAFNDHQAVLFAEAIESLAIKPDGIYLDATFGRGGHARAILTSLNAKGRLLAIDKDPAAVAYARQHFAADPRFTIQHGSFAELEAFIQREHLVGQIDGILLDLGVSSPQLDDPERGFSFLRTGKLDMRMDDTQGIDAATWIAQVDEKELADVLWQYGEERYSRRLAKAIVMHRQVTPITTTTQLADIIAKAHPAWQKGKHPATKSFQAIRIFLNNELVDLTKALVQAVNVLRIQGRLVVISFHSLEDRMVKQFMQEEERGPELPAGLPVKHTLFTQSFRRVGRAIKPSEQEIMDNPRARSAMLRIGEKL